MATRRKRRGGITLFKVRDAIAMGIGSFMFLYMTLTWRINPYLVGAALALLGAPSVVGAFNLGRGSETPEDTTDSSSDSPSPSRSQL